MNISELDKLCKKKARKCFENFKSWLENNPYDCKIDANFINQAILWEIEQEFTKSIYKKYMGDASDIQFKVVESYTKKYLNLTKKTAINFGMKYIA